MSSAHNVWTSNDAGCAQTSDQGSRAVNVPPSGSGIQSNHPAVNSPNGQRQPNLSGLPRVVASSPGIMEDLGSQAPSEESPQQHPPQRWRSNVGLQAAATRYPAYSTSPGLVGTPYQSGAPWSYQQSLPTGQFPPDMPYEAAAESGTIPGEGQESMMWYDQLFATSFSAIDNPFLAAAHLDPSIDPTWSYLR